MVRFLPIALLLLLGPLVHAQRVPMTTASDEARAHFVRGLHALGHADFDRGRAHLDAALDADPNFALARMYRASTAPPTEREAHMQQAEARLADVSDGERMMVEAYRANMDGDSDREIATLAAVAERYPDDPFPAFIAGWRHYGAERYAEAEAAGRQALAADPAFAPAYNLLGYTYLNRGNHAAAETALLNYVRLAPDAANPYDSLGELYLNMDRYDEAADLFERALARDPEFTVARDNLVRAHIGMVNQQFEAAVAAQDADALAALYTEGARLIPPGEPAVTGRDAIRGHWAAAFAAGVDGADLETHEVYAMGDTATELGAVDIRAGGQAAGGARYTVVWAKDGDAWRLHRDIWNSGGSASGGTD